MHPLRSEKCSFAECYKVPNYGFIGSKPKFCNTHKSEGMVDVKMPKCLHEVRDANGNVTRPCTK